MSSHSILLYEINLRVSEIAAELRNADIFVSHDLVAQILADRYNVLSLSQLGILSPKSIPLLGLIFLLNCATYNYCASYIATHEISSIVNIEDGLLLHLRSLNLPSLLSVSSFESTNKQVDPNELSLSEDDENNAKESGESKINCYLDFGLGRLSKSPALIHVFGATKDGYARSESAVLHNLSRLITMQETETVGSLNRDYFVGWLCQEWKISALNEVGILIQSDIDNSIATIRSTLRSKLSLLYSHKRRLQQQLSLLENEENDRLECNKRKRRKKQSLLREVNHEGDRNIFSKVINAVENEQGSRSHNDSINLADIIGQVIDDLAVSRSVTESNDNAYGDTDIIRSVAITAIERCLKSHKQEPEFVQSGGRKPQLLSNVDTRRNFGITTNNESATIPDSTWKEYIVEITNEMLQPIMQQSITPFTSSSLSNQDIGRLGESTVYRYLQQSLPTQRFSIQWLNQENESKAAYDLILEDRTAESGSTFRHKIFVEVKSSRYEENNVFSISLWEWQFITQLPRVEYHIYRVYGVGDPHKTRITILKDAQKLLELGRIHLCLSV